MNSLHSFRRSFRAGVSRIDVLVVVTLIAIVLTVPFATFKAKNLSDQQEVVCQDNLKQIGLGLIEYCQDYDDYLPETRLNPGIKSRPAINIGWAGPVYPYIRSTALFVCPADSSTSDVSTQGSVPISYAINSNTPNHSLADYNAPAQTVMAFEISHDQANLNITTENRFAGASQLSAAGDGVDGRLLSAARPISSLNPQPLYATGVLDNSNPTIPVLRSQFPSRTGRHYGGSNFLAVDGHIKWVLPSEVSAGANAARSNNPQSSSGCTADIGPSWWSVPCAEGTGLSAHVFTFSLR